jgi:phage terminase large subunit
VDTYTGKTEKRFGFKTTSLTRPTIISRLIEVIREHCNTVNDIDTLEELLTIIRNERGRIEAPEGGHDDMMMALAIAHHIREQVVIPNDIMEMGAHDPFGLAREFGSEDERGTERTII